MIRFVYPNVSYSGREFIGCGRYALFDGAPSPPASYRPLDGLPNTANTSALIKAAKVLAGIPYQTGRLICEAEDPHDPEEDYQGDSCSLAFLLALIHRARKIAGNEDQDLDVWCTGTIRFDDRPRLEAVFPSGFDVKLMGFLKSGEAEHLFIVPAANVLQHHEALCRKGNVRIVELSRQRAESCFALREQKTLLKVDFDELPDLVDWLFESVNGGKGARSSALRRRWGLLAGLAALVVLFSLQIGGFFGNGMKQGDAQAREAFSLLHRGELDKAGDLFRAADGGGILPRLGLAALHLSRGDLRSVEQILAETQAEGVVSPYAAVMHGHLLLARGRQAEAEDAYRRALAGEGLESWQAAEGHFGLGRIHLRREQFDQALVELNRAIDLDPHFVQAFTAKGLVLEKQGFSQKAGETFATALTIHPGEPISGLLALRSRERLAEERESERRARIDALVTDLARAYREGAGTEVGPDEWTSRPLHIVFLPFEAAGQPVLREGEDVFLFEKIVRTFVGPTRIQLVERAVIERLLQELKLSSSEAANPETALRLGKILSARIIAVGGVNRYAGELEVTLRAIDTETSLVTVAVSGACPLAEAPKVMLETLARDFQDRIAAAYPIRGRLAAVEGGRVRVNVGAGVGVTPGMRFVLVEGENQGLELLVTEVQPDSSTAVCADGVVPLQRGWRVEGA
jgi:tetratricopeptide (TPR) repeat protein